MLQAAPPLIFANDNQGAAVASGIGDVFGNANNLLQQIFMSKIKEKQQIGLLEQELSIKARLASEAAAVKQQNLLSRSHKLGELLQGSSDFKQELQAFAEAGMLTPATVSNILSSKAAAESRNDPEYRKLRNDKLKAEIRFLDARKGVVGKSLAPKPLTDAQKSTMTTEFYVKAKDIGYNAKSPAGQLALKAKLSGDIDSFNRFVEASAQARALKTGAEAEIKKNPDILKLLTPAEMTIYEQFKAEYNSDPEVALKKFGPIYQSISQRLSGVDTKTLQEEAFKKQQRDINNRDLRAFPGQFLQDALGGAQNAIDNAYTADDEDFPPDYYDPRTQ